MPIQLRRILLLLVLLSACAAPPAPLADSADATPRATIFILAKEWHTEIAIPTAPLTGGITRFHAIFPQAEYLAFGFGERLYFQKQNTDFTDQLRAILPGPGTVLTTALAGPPPVVLPRDEMVALRVSQAELDRIADFVWESLEKSPAGALNRLGDGPFPGYVFYGAATTYSGLYTCNTWTLEALDAGGLDVGASGVLFASQAMDRVRRLAGQPQRMAAAR